MLVQGWPHSQIERGRWSRSHERRRPAIADIAYQNKSVIYDLLFKVSAQTMLKVAANPKHLGARIGLTSVLHTWGSVMTHHPHTPDAYA